MACGGNGIIPAVRFSGRVLLFCVGGIVSVLIDMVSRQCLYGVSSVFIWCLIIVDLVFHQC